MYSVTTIAITVLIVLVILLIIWYLTSKNRTVTYKSKSALVDKDDDLRLLIDRMNREGWMILMMEGCGHCRNLANDFGPLLEQVQHGYINGPKTGNISKEVIEEAKKECRGYPSFYRRLINGKVHTIPGYGSARRILTEMDKLV